MVKVGVGENNNNNNKEEEINKWIFFCNLYISIFHTHTHQNDELLWKNGVQNRCIDTNISFTVSIYILNINK